MGQFLRLHATPSAFREALLFTEATSGFAQRLIEKDYYCSLILTDFEPLFSRGLVFKGGTCLSKVYTDFYRLSEDLDFAISVPTTARPQDRRDARLPVKRHLKWTPPAIRDIFDIDEAVRAKRLDLSEPGFISLVRQKLAVPRNVALDTSQSRRKSLKGQLETHLKPVLRSFDYATFDIDRALATIGELAALIRGG